MDKKIQHQKDIGKVVNRLKKESKRIVTLSGSFDILHIGHIRSLREAKSKGDVLIVLLNSDKSVRSYKGPTRPIIPEKERIEILSALEFVDYVVIFDEINPISIIDRIKPHIHCNGSDWGKDCVEREVVERNGGRIHVLKWQEGVSTTGLINKILGVYSVPPVKAVFIDRDGTINENKDGYIHKIEDFEFTPNAINALKPLSKTEYKIIIITNQSGIGRGLYTEGDLTRLHQWMLDKFQKENIRVDKIYFCPHAPEDKCSCRKPEIGMLMQAVNDFGTSMNDSWLIGDDPKDIIMGRMANVRTIKIGAKMPAKLKLQPNYYAKDLLEAVNIILDRWDNVKK